MESEVTVVVTSCNRIEFLQKTIESFLAINDYPIAEFIIIDDSGNSEAHRRINLLYPNYTRIFNGKNEGLIDSIDRAYSMVKTPFIMHFEDDWEFIQGGFIDPAIKIIRNNHMVMQVWISNIHNQPIDEEVLIADSVPYRYAKLDGMDHLWHGFTLNPSLRSTRIYKEAAPWSQWSPPTDFLALRECKIGEEYFRRSYRAAVLNGEHCVHKGGADSTWAK
jgi:hypothetical protein